MHSSKGVRHHELIELTPKRAALSPFHLEAQRQAFSFYSKEPKLQV